MRPERTTTTPGPGQVENGATNSYEECKRDRTDEKTRKDVRVQLSSLLVSAARIQDEQLEASLGSHQAGDNKNIFVNGICASFLCSRR